MSYLVRFNLFLPSQSVLSHHSSSLIFPSFITFSNLIHHVLYFYPLNFTLFLILRSTLPCYSSSIIQSIIHHHFSYALFFLPTLFICSISVLLFCFIIHFSNVISFTMQVFREHFMLSRHCTKIKYYYYYYKLAKIHLKQ